MATKTLAQYGAMVAAAHGEGRLGIPPAVAREYLEKTPASKRSAFARANARKRKIHLRRKRS